MENKINAIIIEDEELSRKLIISYLKGFTDINIIRECANGFEGIKAINKLNPQLVFLDIQMPKASGIEVTLWVRANQHDVGVLILTAYDDDPYVMAVLRAGANGYVLKTASPREIIRAVRDVHAGNSALDASIVQIMMTQFHTGEHHKPVEELTEREIEVLALVAKGFTNKAIGVQLGISDRTVQGHLSHIFNKLQAGSRTEAVMRSVSLGWLPADLDQMDG